MELITVCGENKVLKIQHCIDVKHNQQNNFFENSKLFSYLHFHYSKGSDTFYKWNKRIQ